MAAVACAGQRVSVIRAYRMRGRFLKCAFLRIKSLRHMCLTYNRLVKRRSASARFSLSWTMWAFVLVASVLPALFVNGLPSEVQSFIGTRSSWERPISDVFTTRPVPTAGKEPEPLEL